MKNARNSRTLRVHQRGVSLIEFLLYSALAALVLAGLVIVGRGLYNNVNGGEEGKRISFVTDCGVQLAKRFNISNLSTITLPTLINNQCFGKYPGVTNFGTAQATANSQLTGEALVVAGINLIGTNDGLAITTTSPARYCSGVVQGAESSGAVQISVTPSGGAPVIVKPLNGNLDVTSVGLATACNGTEPISIQIVASK